MGPFLVRIRRSYLWPRSGDDVGRATAKRAGNDGEASSALVTLFFTGLVGSTERLSRTGDEKARHRFAELGMLGWSRPGDELAAQLG
jgi:hypothetical protein